MKPVQLIFPPGADNTGWRTVMLSTLATRGPSRILVAPGALVLARETETVGRTEAQARAATLASLAPDLAAAPRESLCALGPARGTRRLAFVIATDAAQQLLAEARANGFAPDMITPDFALLPPPEAGEATVAAGEECLVRTSQGGFACQADHLPLLLGELRRRDVDLDTAVAGFVRSGRHADLPNLMPAARATPAPAAAGLPLLAIGATAAALAVFAALPWIDAFRLDAATAGLRAETEAIARDALPGAQRIVNPLAQLREARLPRSSAIEGLSRATVLMEGLARSPGVNVVRMDLGEGDVSAKVSVANTSLLQPLRDHVAANGLQIVETPGLSEPNSIPVEIQVVAP